MAIGETILEIEKLEHRLRSPHRSEEFTVRVEGNLRFLAGTLTALVGKSGCGKTTLLSVLGLLRRPTELETLNRFVIQVPAHDGEQVPLQPIDLKDLYERRNLNEVERLRRRHLGFALQSGELHPALTVCENIAVPLYLNRWNRGRREQRVRELLNVFQLEQTADAPDNGHVGGIARSGVHLLSGGEYQRVALARAIAHRPSLLFVDEPTASLDHERARLALTELRRSLGMQAQPGVVVMITHDLDLAQDFADVIVEMESCGSQGKPAGRVKCQTDNTPRREHEWNCAPKAVLTE